MDNTIELALRNVMAGYEGEPSFIHELIAAVRADEREACARLVESMAVDDLGNVGNQCFSCAAAIRARGEG